MALAMHFAMPPEAESQSGKKERTKMATILNPSLQLEQRALTSTIHFRQTTTSTPEQFIAGLTDFGPGRSKLFGNSADAYLSVHHMGSGYADVTEGSGGIWERLHYDWSNPDRVVLTTADSNVWGPGSGHIYTFTRKADGTTGVELVVVREGKNFKGWALGLLLRTAGKGVLRRAFENSLKAIEERNYAIGVEPAEAGNRNRNAA
jgi:hypothetical protein